MPRYVALLRGINVGGKHKLPMKDLAAMFEQVGCSNVVTYIQSGNVIFDAPAAFARSVPVVMHDAIAERFGYDVPVVTRTGAQVARVLEANPFDGVPENEVHVFFLSKKPAASKVAALDLERSLPDELRVVGQELYLHCRTGMAKTKISNVWLDRQLGIVSTARNWKTTQKLAELAAS
ncbi:MAG: DUF1697 domain-containing protein [Planctomycetes bacterium]|nr:DUF1697 domain-containing protein [Planctomycetota bacterium]MCB9917013.1 DUF1697 domain-containing protein [Planctomycetota bacterium]